MSQNLVYTAYLIAQWIFLSSTIILFNKYLLDTAKFHFPLTLVPLRLQPGTCTLGIHRVGSLRSSPSLRRSLLVSSPAAVGADAHALYHVLRPLLEENGLGRGDCAP